MDANQITSIIAIMGTLLGTILGGGVSYALQSKAHKQAKVLSELDFARNKKMDVYLDLLEKINVGQLTFMIKQLENNSLDLNDDMPEVSIYIDQLREYIINNYYRFSLICDEKVLYELGWLSGYCNSIMTRINSGEIQVTRDEEILPILESLHKKAITIESLMRHEFKS